VNWLAHHLGQVLVVDPVAVEVAQLELVERLVEQEGQQEPEEVELALEVVEFALEGVELALVEAKILLDSVAVLEKGGPRVGKAQSNYTGILEGCLLLQ